MQKIRASILCVILIAATVHSARSDQASQPPIPDIVQRASAVFATNVHGVIGMQRHFTTVIRAGPIHHTEKSDSGFLMRDGSFVKIKYYRIADDERAFAADEIDARDAQTNHAWEEGKVFFREPYDPRFIAEYRFEETPCEACSADLVSVNFSSDLHDSQHGNGTMWIETTTAHVVKLTYAPNQLPQHATSGTVTETSSEAMPSLWYVTRIESTYKGHAFLLRGSATFTATFDRFQRFGKEDVAYEALQDGTI